MFENFTDTFTDQAELVQRTLLRHGAVPESRAATEADFRVLESLLLRLDPASAWGSLSRTVTPEGLTLYLCREHSLAYRRTARL
jgi:hypothetical protein